ncbi:hypothetical protein F4775DRAFT_595351 [Biscogniauxia sp. FL1348]|nr:hypothetical protein F4775DRAFT_595351 [Biscogniauxia sp. FL1348]
MPGNALCWSDLPRTSTVPTATAGVDHDIPSYRIAPSSGIELLLSGDLIGLITGARSDTLAKPKWCMPNEAKGTEPGGRAASSTPSASGLMQFLPHQLEDGPLPQPAAGTDVNSSILSRLQKLEQAVFGNHQENDIPNIPTGGRCRTQAGLANKTEATAPSHAPSPADLDNERQQTAKFLDSAYTRDDNRVFIQAGELCFRISNAASLVKTIRDNETTGNGRKVIWMMPQEEALLLLQDFVDNPYHLLPIIHEASTRSLINKVYSQLEHGEAVDLKCAALILGIAALSAQFFNGDMSSRHIFPTPEEAAQVSVAWSQSALSILEESCRSSRDSMEEVQARIILAYVIYNAEGCSSRFRFLHSCSLAAARDISLHLLDSPSMADKLGDLTTREIKRRLWWHLASTDWLLGLMGGPLDGTYTVQPRHMNVKLPRNLNDSDLGIVSDTTTFPVEIPTQMSCFLQRIRLAEICRAVVDARAPGSPDVEITDFDTVSSLDGLFKQALAEFPPFLHIEEPVPPGSPRHLALQRALILLGFHIRRARLHRPFLLHDTENQRYLPSREQCLRSARTVLDISIELLDGSLAVNQTETGPQPYRLGLVISAMFMATTILALSIGLDSARAIPSNVGGADTHRELSRACRVLAAVGKTSEVAAGLVRGLKGVLRRYRVSGIDDPDGPTALPNDHDRPYVSSMGLGASPPAESLENGRDGNMPIDLEFEGLWSDVLSGMPLMEGYDQIFADLDVYCGPTV